MIKAAHVVLGAVLIATLIPVAEASAAECSADVAQPSGALYRTCMPATWNGDLVVFAHGYVADLGQPLEIPETQLVLPDGTSIPDLAMALGFAFATTSYPVNGLAVKEGVADVRELVDYFTAQEEAPADVYLVGASEGGLITALAVEQFPEVFSGGLATCGPVGSFWWQIVYHGDFRVVFDYFFPGVIDGPAFPVPQNVIDDWETVWEPAVVAALAANPAATAELVAVTRLPHDPADPATIQDAILGVLWYNVFATNDAIAKLGGQPYDNRFRNYTGSSDDVLLNAGVARYQADAAAVGEILASYETSGVLASPLVTLHTTGDPIIPIWQEALYTWKAGLAGSVLHLDLPVERYGHCQFEPVEAVVALVVLYYLVNILP